MSILVTGGTGFVGRRLVQALLEENRGPLTLLVRDAARLDACPFAARVTVVRGDLFAGEPLPREIDTVFHLAAVTKAQQAGEFTRVNVEGTRALLARLSGLKRLRRVLLLSSQAAAGPSRGAQAVDEQTPAEPVSLYGKSKLAQEEAVRSLAPAPHVIIRAPIVFGPGDMDMLRAFRIAARGIVPLLGRVPRRYSLIYVDDLVGAMIAAAFADCENETFYAANREAVEWRELLELSARLLGRRRTRTVVVPLALAGLAAALSEIHGRWRGKPVIFNRDKFREMRFPSWVCSAAKIAARLHVQPQVQLPTALAETLAWYREQKLL